MDFGAAAQPALLLARRGERAIRILVDELNVRLMRKLGAGRREFFDTIDRPALPCRCRLSPISTPNGGVPVWRRIFLWKFSGTFTRCRPA